MAAARLDAGELLFAFPDSEGAINSFGRAIMRGPSSLAPAERELIAAYVSARNGCDFCSLVHAATARQLFGDRAAIVDDALNGAGAERLDPKMRALLAIADRVRDGQSANAVELARARVAGADDRAIHDAVLVAAMFCMFNRYVDGFGRAPIDPAVCEEIAARNADADGFECSEPTILGPETRPTSI